MYVFKNRTQYVLSKNVYYDKDGKIAYIDWMSDYKTTQETAVRFTKEEKEFLEKQNPLLEPIKVKVKE